MGTGGTRGARLAEEDELVNVLPVGETGDETPLTPPGLFVPLLLPPPRKRELLQKYECQQCLVARVRGDRSAD